MDPKAEETIQVRQVAQKKALIDELKKMPIIEVACRKTDTGRTTYYRWRDEDTEFAREADEAIKFGKSIINDLAESKVITGIKNDDRTYTIYWLNNNHKTYVNKFKTSQIMKEEIIDLTDEEIQKLSSLLYNTDTFYQGQELLTSYVIRGKISDRQALFILKLFLTQMRVEDVTNRKTETKVMNEVLFREKVNKFKK